MATPYRPVVTEGDPNQPQTGCNVTQPAGAFSENQPSAAERAAQGVREYAAYQANNRQALAAFEDNEKQRREQDRIKHHLRRRNLSHKDISG